MTTGWPVRPETETALVAAMARLGIRAEDLVEKFVRSSGPGGQNVNKVSTAVYLKHLPSGVEVKAQQTRSQAMNRFLARRMLVAKLEARILGAKSAAVQRIEKIRRQKRRRSRRAKARMLDDKRHQAAKKSGRQTPRGDD
ncbi:MAG: peptide chain release factor-like protein [Deltaproteobacteria bacterium]|nr:peptide chain release factor-like protein [Deltaproteobacteria bacterium]